MLHIKKIEDGIDLYKALGSDLRIQIIKLLLEKGEMNMNEIAGSLGITNGALTSHIKKLEECGLVSVLSEHEATKSSAGSTQTGSSLMLCLRFRKKTKIFTLWIFPWASTPIIRCLPPAASLPGKASSEKWTTPDILPIPSGPRTRAGILWFSRGYVEYLIPNFLPPHCEVEQLILSVEIASEAPGTNNDWPSDITFFLNETPVGTWTSPGDFGDIHGLFTPGWWLPTWNQYGLLKTLIINKNGTFIDGRKISDVAIGQFSLDYKSSLRFKFMVSENADHPGGLTLFGKGFGNYNQDIQVVVSYTPLQD